MNINLIPAVLILLLFYALGSSASDIASTVRGERPHEFENGGYMELGVNAGYTTNPFIPSQTNFKGPYLDIHIAGEFRKNGFFFEATQGTQDGVNLGYTLWENKNWAIDFLGASMSGELNLDRDQDINVVDDEAARNKKLEGQDTFYLGTGFRITRYLGEYVVQYRLITDTYDNNGLMSTFRLGRGWQVRGWYLHSILSASYVSAKANSYWFGVEEEQASQKYPAYSAGDSTSLGLLLGFTKPITENWVARGFFGYYPLSDEVKDSPLVEDKDYMLTALTINYVFF